MRSIEATNEKRVHQFLIKSHAKTYIRQCKTHTFGHQILSIYRQIKDFFVDLQYLHNILWYLQKNFLAIFTDVYFFIYKVVRILKILKIMFICQIFYVKFTTTSKFYDKIALKQPEPMMIDLHLLCLLFLESSYEKNVKH